MITNAILGLRGFGALGVQTASNMPTSFCVHSALRSLISDNPTVNGIVGPNALFRLLATNSRLSDCVCSLQRRVQLVYDLSEKAGLVHDLGERI
jgi:hypothetical protein